MSEAEQTVAEPERDAGEQQPATAGTILKKTARGAVWLVGLRMARRLLGLINLIVLARLLVPSDYGIVGLAVALAGTLDAFANIGVSDALTREAKLDRALYDTGFTLNVLRGLLTGGMLAVAAEPAARFFGDPRLTLVVLVLAGCTILGGFANIGPVDFRRDLAFEKQFLLLGVPRLAGFVVTLVTALQWRNYWALVAGIVTTRLLGIVLSYLMHSYRPTFTLRAWRILVGFSTWSWALTIAETVRDRTGSFVLGHFLGDAAVGSYSLGEDIATLPSNELAAPLGHASYSAFAAARHSGQHSGPIYLRVVAAVGLISFPACIGISAIAGPAVRLLLGTKWLQVIPLVQVLGPVAAWAVIESISANLLTVYGMLANRFRIMAVAAALRVLLLVLLVQPFGLMGAVFANGAAAIIECGWYLVVTCRDFQITRKDLVGRVWRILFGTSAMSLVLAATKFGWASPPHSDTFVTIAFLMEAVAIGIMTYGMVVVTAWVASGRPDGPEADLLYLLRGRARRVGLA